MATTTNPGQANAYFKDILDGFGEIENDPYQKGAGDVSMANSGTAVQKRQQQNAVERTPWIISTSEWLRGSPPRGIVWNANPSDVTWNMAQRSVHTKNLFGTVLHVWPDTKRSTFFDEFRLTFSLQTGNLMPVFFTEFNKYQPSGGIVNFYDFMQLVDAPKLTDENPPRTNLVSIQYSSPLFPKLTLVGMFDSSGIRFTDSSSSPNNVTGWSADFVVYDTMPRMGGHSGQQNSVDLLKAWAKARIDDAKLAKPPGT
jgi:hypothetical protein